MTGLLQMVFNFCKSMKLKRAEKLKEVNVNYDTSVFLEETKMTPCLIET